MPYNMPHRSRPFDDTAPVLSVDSGQNSLVQTQPFNHAAPVWYSSYKRHFNTEQTTTNINAQVTNRSIMLNDCFSSDDTTDDLSAPNSITLKFVVANEAESLQPGMMCKE